MLRNHDDDHARAVGGFSLNQKYVFPWIRYRSVQDEHRLIDVACAWCGERHTPAEWARLSQADATECLYGPMSWLGKRLHVWHLPYETTPPLKLEICKVETPGELSDAP